MPSRRDFLHLTSLALPALWLRPALGHARASAARPLFFDAEALPALRTRFARHPLFAGLREQLAAFDRAGEQRFLAEEVRFNDHLFDLRRVSETARQMAFVYAMTTDEDAADLAVTALRTLMRFPKWDYFLEGGTQVVGIQRAAGATVAVATGADWLGDAVDPAERADWLRTMGVRGCEACFLSIFGMRFKDRVQGWTMDETSTYFEHRPGDRIDLSNWPTILDRTNLKAVPASALALGAVAYQQHLGADEDTARWLEQAVYSLASFEDLYARDGSYDEGVSYANYTSTHLAQATAVLRRFAGIDLYDRINWPGFVEYIYALTMPTTADPHAIVNFGDAGTGMGSAVPFWIAHRAHDARAQWFGQHHARAHDEWSLLWYDPEVPAAGPPEGPHLWQSALDWIVARTGYAAGDLVVAMRSGGPSNHEHADRNSLLVTCFGEPLVADPYRPPYSFSDPSWMLRTTAGHSALLIDGAGHQYHDGSEGTNPSDARARIVRRGTRDGYFFWTSDATPAYRLVLPDVESVTRTVVILYDVPAVLVLDKVVKRTTASRLTARFYAYNLDGAGRTEATADGFVTTRPGASLRAVGAAPGGVVAATGYLPIPEDVARLHPFADVGTQDARLDPLLVTVLLPERGAGGTASVERQPQPDGTLVLTLTNQGHAARCHLLDTGTLPEFAITL